jgi:hypothetical protein
MDKVKDTFVDTSLVFLREINPIVAKDIIVRNHYSHKWSMCSVALGVFYKKDPEAESFFDNDTEHLIGCIVYGTPVGRCAAESVSDQLKANEVYELVRLWIADLPDCKNIESYCISQSFRWLRKNRPQIKALISYADNEAGHTGIIYQSTNWLYQGNSSLTIMPNYSISLTKNPYVWIHSRTVSEKYGSVNLDHLKKCIGHTFYRKREGAKHRFIYILKKGRERQKLIDSLKHKTYPYPKIAFHVDDATEIYVDPSQSVTHISTLFFS